MTRKFGWRVDRSTLRGAKGRSSPEVATQAAPPAAAAPTPTAPRKVRRLTPRDLDDVIGWSCIVPPHLAYRSASWPLRTPVNALPRNTRQRPGGFPAPGIRPRRLVALRN